MPMHGFSIVAPAQSGADAAPTTTTTEPAPGDGAPTGTPQPPVWNSIVPMVLIFVIMYLLLIRPQQKRQKEHRELVSRLKAGDRVMTNGGIFGTIVGVKDTTVTVRIAEKVEIEVVRSAVNTVITEKSAGGDGAKA